MCIIDTTTKKITTINIYNEDGVEISNDFYESGSMDYSEELEVFYGDVEYMISQLHDLLNHEGDFADFEHNTTCITYTIG